MRRWGHLHTFLAGAAVALAVVHWWLLALFVLAACAVGLALGVLLARGAWVAAGRVASWIQHGRLPAFPDVHQLIPPGSEIQVIAKPRASRYDRTRLG